MTVTIYIATGNPGKLRDFAAAQPAHIALTPLPGLDHIPAPVEDQPTFEDNARLKAIYYSRLAAESLAAESPAPEFSVAEIPAPEFAASEFSVPGPIVLADDSGLEVDALQGEPGVRSARFAADAGLSAAAASSPHSSPAELSETDRRNNLYLLQRLAGIDARRARYRCVLAGARNGVVLATAEGSVEGELLTAPRGSGGFGYDPLFYLPALGKTMAELDLATRLEYSHRGRALRALLPLLTSAIDAHIIDP